MKCTLSSVFMILSITSLSPMEVFSFLLTLYLKMCQQRSIASLTTLLQLTILGPLVPVSNSSLVAPSLVFLLEPTYCKDICPTISEIFFFLEETNILSDTSKVQINHLQKVISIQICTQGGYKSQNFRDFYSIQI